MARTRIDTGSKKTVTPVAPVTDVPTSEKAETGMGDSVIPLVNPTPTSNYVFKVEAPPAPKKWTVTKAGKMGYKGMNLAYSLGQVITEHEDIDAILAAGIELKEV
jgi:hypothetical protein